MPTFNQLVRDRAARLNRAPQALLTRVDRIQKSALQTVIELLGSLERDGDTIIRNASNLAKSAEITNALKGILTGKEYLSALAEFASEFDKTKVANDKIFAKTFTDFTTNEVADLTLQQSKAYAVELLAGATAQTGFLLPLRGAIEQAVTSGASWQQTLKQMSTLINGDADVLGKLEQHVKQVAWDALAVADRSYSFSVAEDLGAEWFLYAGTEIQTTREFCQERVGKYFRRAEIESWANLDWAGKMQDTTNSTTIFQNLGGWNCRHVLVPVSAAIVPDEFKK